MRFDSYLRNILFHAILHARLYSFVLWQRLSRSASALVEPNAAAFAIADIEYIAAGTFIAYSLPHHNSRSTCDMIETISSASSLLDGVLLHFSFESTIHTHASANIRLYTFSFLFSASPYWGSYRSCACKRATINRWHCTRDEG